MAAPLKQYQKFNLTNVLNTKCKYLSIDGNTIALDFAELVNLETLQIITLSTDANPIVDFTTLVNLKNLQIDNYDGTAVGSLTLPASIISNLEKLYLTKYGAGGGTVSIPSIPLSANIKEFKYTSNALNSILSLPPTMANCYKFNVQDSDLDQTNVDNILLALDANGLTQGFCSLTGGAMSPPSGAGYTAAANLTGKGWTVSTM